MQRVGKSGQLASNLKGGTRHPRIGHKPGHKLCDDTTPAHLEVSRRRSSIDRSKGGMLSFGDLGGPHRTDTLVCVGAYTAEGCTGKLVKFKSRLGDLRSRSCNRYVRRGGVCGSASDSRIADSSNSIMPTPTPAVTCGAAWHVSSSTFAASSAAVLLPHIMLP